MPDSISACALLNMPCCIHDWRTSICWKLHKVFFPIANLSQYLPGWIASSCKWFNTSSSTLRFINYEVEDVNGATNVLNATIRLTIIPVNDPPHLFLNVGRDSIFRFRHNFFPFPGIADENTRATYQYTEDDPPLSLVPNVYLRDFDSNISTSVLVLESE